MSYVFEGSSLIFLDKVVKKYDFYGHSDKAVPFRNSSKAYITCPEVWIARVLKNIDAKYNLIVLRILLEVNCVKESD